MSRPGDRLAAAPLADDPSFLIARLNALALAVGNRALAEFDLRVRSFSVLGLACSGLRPTQREIADFIQLDPSQIVALVDELEARELVTRVPTSSDRRSNAIVGTAEGQRTLERADAAMRDAQESIFGGIGTDRLEALKGDLRGVMFPHLGQPVERSAR